MGGWEKFNHFAIMMLKIAYVNILWISFTLLGLGVLGLFPSTGAMFAIVQKWLRKEPVEKIFQSFWKTYKNEFISLNKFGLFFILIGYILLYDFMFLQKNIDKLQFLFPILLFLAISYFVTLLYFFPVYLQFDLKYFQYIKQAFLIAASSLLETILILTACMLVGIVVNLIPGMIPFFTGSVLALAVTWSSNRAFLKINKKKLITQ
ncbi:YesL family protein [Bacillus timonensis]|uniref:YesL family protein n=1 Tax=Bacillus timonensis TaxID=1033734 RepID=UPI000288D435|nr:DUF624 domain-containing protein [Bacillus timonensis]